jgi:hypothetical protein
MRCHHYCNEPLRCPECQRRFWQWAQARTNSPPRKGQVHNFYDHVNVVSPPVQVTEEKG